MTGVDLENFDLPATDLVDNGYGDGDGNGYGYGNGNGGSPAEWK